MLWLKVTTDSLLLTGYNNEPFEIAQKRKANDCEYWRRLSGFLTQSSPLPQLQLAQVCGMDERIGSKACEALLSNAKCPKETELGCGDQLVIQYGININLFMILICGLESCEIRLKSIPDN